MFTIHSNLALSWPTLGFRIKKGANRFASRDAVPEAALNKLTFLSKSRAVKFGEDVRRVPAAVRFEEVAAASGATDDEDVELTPEALGKLKLVDLQALAAKLNIDVAGLTSKKQVADRILAAASGATDDEDVDEELDDDDETTDA